jgi:hypothetical protein
VPVTTAVTTPTHRIAFFAGLVDELKHAGGHVGVGTAHGVVFGLRQVQFGVGRFQLQRAHLRHVRLHRDADLPQQQFGHRPGSHAGRRFAGRRPAAAAVVAGAVLGLVRVVGVRRPELVGNVGVVLAPLVFVEDQQGDGRALRLAFEYAGKDLELVFFAPLRGNPRLAGLAAIQFTLDESGVDGQPGRAAVDDHADARTVRLAEGCDAEKLAVGIHRKVWS